MSYGMGQNFNPYALRMGVIRDFDSKWYEEELDIDYLAVDLENDNYLKKRFSNASNISIYGSSFLQRKIRLEKILGKKTYKRMVKTLSR